MRTLIISSPREKFATIRYHIQRFFEAVQPRVIDAGVILKCKQSKPENT